MLQVEDLRKRWGGVSALAGFDLTVEAGEICGLLGHNGAGKTTFARICAGLDRPDAGRVRVCGLDLCAEPARVRALVGLAPQEIALYPTATVRENLRFFGALGGIRRAALRREIAGIAESVMLTDVLDRTVRTLSGGQQRRAQAATALLHRPAVLLLDEPTVGADPVTRRALLDLVRGRAEQGTAVCYTTHYLPELEVLGATVAVARAGRVIARGRCEQLLAGLPSRVALGFAAGSADAAALAARAAVAVAVGEQVAVAEDGAVTFCAGRPARALAHVLGALGERAAGVDRVEVDEPTLDDLYQHLTARESEAEAEYVR